MLSLYAIFFKNMIFLYIIWGVPSTSYPKLVSDKNLHVLIHIKYLKAEKKVFARLNGKQNLNQLCLFILCIITQKIYIVVVVKKGNITNTYRVFNSVGFLKVLAMNILHHNAEHCMLKRNWLQHQMPPLYQTKMKTQLVFMLLREFKFNSLNSGYLYTGM